MKQTQQQKKQHSFFFLIQATIRVPEKFSTISLTNLKNE